MARARPLARLRLGEPEAGAVYDCQDRAPELQRQRIVRIGCMKYGEAGLACEDDYIWKSHKKSG